MRVLTIVEDLGPGGTQRVAQNFSLGYRQGGHEVAVLSCSGGPRADVLQQAGIPIFLGGDGSEEAAIQAAASWEPDLLHIHRPGRPDPRSGAILRGLKGRAGDPRVLETNVFSRVDYSPDRHLIDVHLLLSKWCLWKWSQWTQGLRPEPIGTVIPNAVDTEHFFPVSEQVRKAFRAEHGIPSDAFVFGRIGQPHIWKWHPMIFDAFAEVARAHAEAHLVLIGVPEELRPAIDKLEKGIRARIVEIGFQHGDEALRACYGGMDVFLHAAYIGESFGMVLAEAMLCARPVITLSTPAKDNSQLEVVGHERGGLVVTNPKAMVAAMQTLMEDKVLYRRLAQAGQEHTSARYSLDAIMPTLLRIAEYAIQADSREALARLLREEPALITHTSDAEIEELLRHTMGGMTPLDRLRMRLVHHPWLYRAWSQWKFR